MKRCFISMLLCICLVMSIMPGLSATASAADDVIDYTVENGDYLFKICRDFGIDYYQCKNAIMLLNGFTSEAQLNRISVGQKVKLPATNAVAATVKASTTTTVSTSTTVAGKTTTTTSSSTVSGITGSGYDVAFYLVQYTVKNGDTLDSICRALGSNYPEYGSMILAMNGIANESKVWAGKTIYIPTRVLPTGSTGFIPVINHTVTSGENMTGICNNCGLNYISNKTLIDGLNNNSNLNNIKVNQKVLIPLKSATASSSSSATVAPAPVVSNTGYNITFNSPENGAPYAAINNVRITKADAGTEVYIIPNANSNYSVKSMAVTRLDTNANVIITENHFVMPQSDVKVTVTYSEGKKLTKSFDSSKGFVEVQKNGENINYALYGDEIIVIAKPKAGFAIESVTFVKASDASVGGTAKKISDGAYSFNMPNYNVKVVVTFSEAKLFTLKSVYIGNGSGTLSYTLNDILITQASRTNTVVVTVNPENGSVMAKDGLTVKTDKIPSVKVNKIDDNHYSFTMPSTDTDCKGIQITCEFVKSTVFAIYARNVEGGYIYFTDSEGNYITSATPDTVVYIVPVAENSKYVKSTAQYAHGDVKVTVNSGAGTQNDSFIMPTSSVEVIPEFSIGVKTYHISKKAPTNGHGNYYVLAAEPGLSVYNDVDKTPENSSIKFIPKPDSGYVLTGVEIWGANAKLYDLSTLTDNGDGTYSFNMPAEDITVWVTYERSTVYKTLTFSSNYSNGGNVNVWIDGAQVYGGEQMRVGATVDINVIPTEGYEIESVVATVSSGNKLLNASSAGNYSYMLGEESDLDIKINFKAIDYEIQYSYPSLEKYKITVNGGTPVSETTKAHAGEEVTITVNDPATVATAAVDEISILTYLESDGEYTFTMPARNVKTQVTYKAP